MNSNQEPYIGMPINLDNCDCDDFMEEIMGGDMNDAPCMNRCNFEEWPLAMAYVPMQPWETTYDPEKALQAGTIFPSLDLWFMGGGTR